jgi:hypothetical protein
MNATFANKKSKDVINKNAQSITFFGSPCDIQSYYIRPGKDMFFWREWFQNFLEDKMCV